MSKAEDLLRVKRESNSHEMSFIGDKMRIVFQAFSVHKEIPRLKRLLVDTISSKRLPRKERKKRLKNVDAFT